MGEINSGDEGDTVEHRVLRKHFGDAWRIWRWVRNQFSATSLGVIGVISLGTGSYIVDLHRTIIALGTKVAVLETRVIPVLEQAAQLTAMNSRVLDLESSTDKRITTLDNTIKLTNSDLDARLSRLERNWDGARTEAGRPVKINRSGRRR